MDDRTDLQQRAEKLYPYQKPSPEQLLKQYGTADELEQYRQHITEAGELRADPGKEQDVLVKLAEIVTKAEHRFYADTLDGDYELLCELARITAERYSYQDEVYLLTPTDTELTCEQFLMLLQVHMQALLDAEKFFGFARIRNKYGFSFVYSCIIDRAEKEYPGTLAEIHKRAEQLSTNREPIQTAEAEKPPKKRKAPQQPSLYIAPVPYYIQPRDKLSAWIFDSCIPTTDVISEVYSIEMHKHRKTNKPVNIYAMLTDESGEFPAELGAMHRVYFQAAVSLFRVNKTITPAMIWEFLTDSRPSKAKTDEIAQCIEDMRSTKLSVNLGDYATDKGIAEDVEWNDYILPVARVKARISGKLVTAYTARDVSAFPSLRLGEISGQIDSVPVDLITNIPGIDRVNNQTILICDTLLSRVRKKNPNHNDHIIKLSTLYEKLGIDAQDRSQKNKLQTVRDTAQKILAHWMWKGEIETFALRRGDKNAVDAIVFCKSAEEMDDFPGMEWARLTGEKPTEKK